jgi:hypothetical protein
MKKPLPKLVLNRETVRMLVDAEPARVLGDVTCTVVTNMFSGCSSNVHADSLLN